VRETKYSCCLRDVGKPDKLKHPFDLPNVRYVLLDVTKDDDVERVMNMIRSSDLSTHNDVDPLPLTLMGVFNNAGVSELRTLEFEDPAAVRWQYEVNVLGPQRLTRAAPPARNGHPLHFPL